MNINQLEYFVTVVQEGSLSVAAKSLYITPQAISKAISDMEKELGLDLLVKSGGDLTATDFGELVYDRAVDLIYSFADFNTFVDHYCEKTQHEGELKVAVGQSPYRGANLKEADFSKFRTSYPRIKLSLMYSESGSCLSALEEGVVDAAITLGRVNRSDLSCVKLFSTPLVLIMSKEHELAGRDAINISDLSCSKIAQPADLRYAYRAITKQLKLRGLSANYTEIKPYLDEYQAFLDTKKGVIFACYDSDLYSIYSDIVIKPLAAEDQFSFPICFVCKDPLKNPTLPLLEKYLVKEMGHQGRSKTNISQTIMERRSGSIKPSNKSSSQDKISRRTSKVRISSTKPAPVSL